MGKIKKAIAISTYKKNGALRVLLNSMHEHMKDELSYVHIADDANGEAKEVFEEFKDKFPLYYSSGNRLGIAQNKNRGIEFFLKKTDATHLILMDDDIEIIAPGLYDALINAKHPHITGFLSNYRDTVEGGVLNSESFFKEFPPKGQTEDLVFCGGAQGVLLFFERRVLEKVGYFDTFWKGKYGFEHSIFSNRINRVLGYYIDWFPIFKKSGKYFKDQGNFPNQYDAKPELDLNRPQWMEQKQVIFDGQSLINKVPYKCQ